jgi:hypothetical protein
MVFRYKLLLIAALLNFLLFPITTFTKNIIIKRNDSDGFREAIKEAMDGDTIWVEPGKYKGPYNFLGKAIVVKSIAGPASTVVDGEKTVTVFTFDHGEDTTSVLDGFTIKRGAGTREYGVLYGGGVFVKQSSCKILNCIFEENIVGSVEQDGRGGGVGTYESQLVILRKNIFRNNQACHGGAGLIIGT